MNSTSYYIKNPRKIGVALVHRMEWLPDKIYLRLLYLFEMGKRLNIRPPQTFQEKLQYLKLFNRKEEYSMMVDKYAVKEYISKIIGSEYIIPTIGVWEHFDDINFDELPEQFVLKTTHGGGSCGVVICRDKKLLNKAEAKLKLETSLKTDIFKSYREWPYKDVPRRIIAEELLKMPNTTELQDYKFFCFDGIPQFLKVDFNRFIEHHANYYDMNWNLLPFGEADLPPIPNHKESKPLNFDKMISIVNELAKGHKFIRIDLYNVDGKIYFGEMTFFPASGLGHFTPIEWDKKLGDLLKLDTIVIKK